jgi:HPt (histidine-containing phosphotransfer) domain-containing protein
MRRAEHEHLVPVLDCQRLRGLAREMDGNAVHRFAAAYRELLPFRVDRIRRTLRDRDAAMDAVLSLKTSSAMVGAVRMEQICHRLEHALVLANHTAAAQAVEDLIRHRPQLQDALDALLAQTFAGTQGFFHGRHGPADGQ